MPMLGYSRDGLLQSRTFRDAHQRIVKSGHVQRVIHLGLQELNYRTPDHPVADPIQHGALRDAHHQGVLDAFEYFMNFTDEESTSGVLTDFDPLETNPPIDD